MPGNDNGIVAFQQNINRDNLQNRDPEFRIHAYSSRPAPPALSVLSLNPPPDTARQKLASCSLPLLLPGETKVKSVIMHALH
jgi:hypothetical protein